MKFGQPPRVQHRSMFCMTEQEREINQLVDAISGLAPEEGQVT
jgi:hypothetical protein